MLVWIGNGSGLFTRLGRDGYPGYLLNLNQSGYNAALNQIILQYDSSLQDVPAFLAQAQGTQGNQSFVRSTSSLMGFAQQIGQNTIQEMVLADTEVRGQTFQSALNEVIRQMKLTGQTVAKCIVSASATQGGQNVGNGVMVLSTQRGDGLQQENLVAELALCICIADSYTGNQIQGQEQFQYVGVLQNANTWDWDWPQGSGANQYVNAISASSYANPNANILTNGDFANFTSGAASNWIIQNGTWGIDFSQGGTGFTGLSSLAINATGKNTAILQPFGSNLGTPVVPIAQRSYAYNLWLRSTAGGGTPYGLGLLLTQPTSPTTGILAVDLVDSLGNITTDAQGNQNTTTINLASVSQSSQWQPFSGVFRTPPATSPTSLQLRIREATPIAGASVLLDNIALSLLTTSYPGGPGFAVFSGNKPFVQNDCFNVLSNNNRAGQIYCSTFQSLFDRLFNMRSLGLLLPSSLTPTIPDSLIYGANGTPIGLSLLLTRSP